MKSMFLSFLLFFIMVGRCAADEIHGKVQSVNVGEGTIEISGVKVDVSKARIKNEKDQPISLTDLVPGDDVDVEGAFKGSARMTAVRVEKEPPQTDKITGRVEAVHLRERIVTVGGVAIHVPVDTFIESRNDERILLEDLSVMDDVECEGSWAGPAQFTASKVEQEE